MNFYTREDLNDKSYEEVAKMLQDSIDDYKKEVDTFKTEQELDDAEKQIIARMEVHEKYLKEVKYNLPDRCEFDGTSYTKNDIAKFIIQFINKMEVEWQYSLGIYEMGKLWKTKDMTTITYYEYDSTLRTLGQLRFKGLDEMKSILAVNEYMKGLHEEYSKDTSYQIYNAQLHDAIMNRREMIKPIDSAGADIQA